MNLHEAVTKSGSPEIQQLQMPPQHPRQLCVISPTCWGDSDSFPSFKIWKKNGLGGQKAQVNVHAVPEKIHI